MDEVDIEDADDLNELEARLYAQLHHEPSGDCDFSTNYKEASPVRQVTATSVINNKSIDRTRIGRYWNNKVNAPIPKNPISEQLGQSNKNESAPSTASGKEKPAETVDKSFQPTVKNLSNLRVNPFASGNGPKTKGSSSQMQSKIPVAAKPKRNNPKETTGPFTRQITKLAHAVKYDAKKQKAKSAKARAKKTQVLEPIEILSNESDIDDVIEVPLPSPKILTIDSSTDEENPKEDESDFVKPQTSIAKETLSRCTSPCSVVSDDFIGQNDRSRLLKENDRPDDEDLQMLQEDFDSLIEMPANTADKSAESFVKPTKTTTDYRVTQTNFRALDVYESESDIQESVYSKGSKTSRPSVVVRLDNESSSDNDDIEEVDVAQKTKRLRKRRASSTNKEFESFIDSTDSEQETETDNMKKRSREGVVLTCVPFIARGEALKDHVTVDQSSRQQLVNSSEKESMATAARENESDEEDENITARAIAETVIQRERRSMHTAESLTVHEEEANDAVPNDSLSELNDVFTVIDNMSQPKPNIANSTDDSDQSVELIAPLPVARRRTRTAQKLEKETGDPVYNVVYCENITDLGGIGWNDEMRKFYNNSWNGERFSVKAVCSRMKTTKSLWKIYTDDRFPKYRKQAHQKCMNCCEFGHIRSRCPKPRKPQICYMCGERGHHEPRCPNTVCLRCGNKTRMFTKSCNACNYQNRLICPICKVRGHSLNLCPDKWRRYHSTTKSNQYPNSKIEYKNRKFCCICGFRGHLAEHCRSAVRFTEYPLFISGVKSHQKSYDDIAIKSIRSGIGYNLMYKPEEDICFELAENKTQRHYYGRFLLAVGMGHLLTRKRKIDDSSKDKQTEKQPKTLKEYVINPFAKAALEKSLSKSTDSICATVSSTKEKPIDLDEPIDVNTPSPANEPMSTDLDNAIAVEPCTSKSVFKEPTPAISTSDVEPSTSTFKTPDAAGSTCGPKQTDVLEIDSDSNYSFSEHFEPNQEREKSPRNAREMGPLPDFISINDNENDSPEEKSGGISKRFVSVETDDENSNIDSNPLPDIPCEAKIYLTTFHSKFLLSPEGNKFLVEKSKTFNIKASLDWTSVGHILVLFGQRFNQDRFHTELLYKFRDLSDKMNRKQLESSQKVPKRTDVLIRFLREHLNQLLTNLGNVNDLAKRLTYQENQHTKSGWKLAEKTRRLLNMILIGQAGLRNGSRHLDDLLTHLRSLIDCKDEFVNNEVRDEIDSHWKLIFSSHRHEKYNELVEAYNHMQVKNRLQTITIDPRLLGRNVIDPTPTKAQKDKPPEFNVETATPVKPNALSKLVQNPASTKNQARQSRTPIVDKKRSRNTPVNLSSISEAPSNSQKQQTQQLVSSFTSSKQNSHVANEINSEWETKCVDLLTEINNTGQIKKGSPVRDSKASSVFWSREAIKYIDECIQLAKSNRGILDKLSRVQAKSQTGLLSYNDYRAIIKIHSAIKGKQ